MVSENKPLILKFSKYKFQEKLHFNDHKGLKFLRSNFACYKIKN